MSPLNAFHQTSSRWVRNELNQLLTDAQQRLEHSIDLQNPDQETLQYIVTILRQVYGTLALLELNSAALLVREMVGLLEALSANQVEATEPAYAALLEAILILLGYLERSEKNRYETPLQLLPTINSLRQSHQLEPLDAYELFTPAITAVATGLDYAGKNQEQISIQLLANELYQKYERDLLAWLRQQGDIATTLANMHNTFSRLYAAAHHTDSRAFWWFTVALIELLQNKKFSGDNNLKILLGRIDQQMRYLAKNGEAKFIEQLPLDLLNRLLYQIANSEIQTPTTSEIKSTFKLDTYWPIGDQAMVSSTMRPDRASIRQVAYEIQEEINQIKDILDFFVYRGSEDLTQLIPLPDLLSKVGDTFGMLGLTALRQQLIDKQKLISQQLSAGETPAATALMELASLLLTAENRLNDYAEGDIQLGLMISSEQSAGNPELRLGIINLARETLKNLVPVKESFLQFIAKGHDKLLIQGVPDTLQRTISVVSNQPLDKILPILIVLKKYFVTELLERQRKPSNLEQDAVADVITSIEYYFEAVIEQQPEFEFFISIAENSIERLQSLIGKEFIAQENSPAEQQQTDSYALPIAVTPPTDAAKAQGEISADKVAEGEIDPEILNIFIEEAVEELERINQSFRAWRKLPEEKSNMITVRRSFHTLKGSGRLIGATDIGEFAWSIENMLNRWLDLSIETTPEFIEVIEESLTILPQLIEQLTGNPEPIADISKLIQKAQQITAGKPISEIPKAESETAEKDSSTFAEATVTESAAETGSETESEPAEVDEPETSESEILLPELFAEFTTDGSAESAIEYESSQGVEISEATVTEPAIADELEEQLTETIEGIPEALVEVIEITGVADEEAATDISSLVVEDSDEKFTADLLDDFCKEAEDYLAEIDKISQKAELGQLSHAQAQILIRSLHTLSGSSRSTGLKIFADYLKLLEQHADNLEALSQSWSLEDLDLLTKVTNQVKKFVMDRDSAAIQLDEALLQKLAQCVDRSSVQPAADAAEQTAAIPLMDTEIDLDLIDVFLEEAPEITNKIDTEFQSWKQQGYNTGAVNEVMRQLHTLKGSANMAGVFAIGELAHTIESVFTAILAGKVAITDEPVTVLTRAIDQLVSCLDQLEQGLLPAKPVEVIESLETIHTKTESANTESDSNAQPEPEEVTADKSAISENLVAIEQSIEEIVAVAADESVETFQPNADDATLIEPDATQLAAVAPDEKDQAATQESAVPAEDSSKQANIEPVVDSRTIAIPAQQEVTSTTDEEQGREPSTTVTRPVTPEANKPAAPPILKTTTAEQVRIRTDKLDTLVNYTGEINAYQTRLAEYVAQSQRNLVEMEQTIIRLKNQLRDIEIQTEAQITARVEREAANPEEDFDPLEMDRYSHMQELSRSLSESASDLENIKDSFHQFVSNMQDTLVNQTKVNRELQGDLQQTRMVNLQTLVSRLQRTVRQTADQFQKRVEMRIEGFTQEVDRSVNERLPAILEHILRNAVYHGIETPEQRRAVGKSEIGIINLKAERDGAYIKITIKDDGAGINIDKIRQRAIESGLLDENADIEPKKIARLIFQEGLSTSTDVNQVAGRGIGLNVVENEIKRLDGDFDIDFEKGKSTTFTLLLPLSLMINQSLIVTVEDNYYAIPSAKIENIVLLPASEIQKNLAGKMPEYDYDGTRYQIYWLGQLLHRDTPLVLDENHRYPLILIHAGLHNIAVYVNEMAGRREILMKTPGPQIVSIPGINGATVLPDGSIALMLDMAGLISNYLAAFSKQASTKPAASVQRKTTIMVVDDSITIRKVTARILERNQFRVLTAKDGLDAIEQLQDNLPDLFIMDIEMPRMDGFELMAHLRSDARLQHIPVIMITSRTGEKHRQRAKHLGVNYYLGKPFQEAELIQQIGKLLK